MRIAVNTRLLLRDKLDGIGIFTRETMRRIVQNHPEHEFLFLFDRPFSSEYIFAENVMPHIVAPLVREPLTCLLWQEWGVPRLLRRQGADLLFSPEPMHSLRADLPKVEVIHDLNYEHRPDYLPFIWRTYYRWFSKRYAKNANRLVTVSKFSREDIVETYGIPKDRIDVIYNGSPERSKRLSVQEQQDVRDQYTGGFPYFYFVGTLHQRKNIAGMLRGFDLFKQTDTEEVRLVIVGRRKWWNREMESAWQKLQHKDSIVFAGRLDDQELAHIAASSIGLLYVPFFEGFGIPILEAFAVGTAVITANVTSMPEVAGEAALLVDPHSTSEISEAMTRLASDRELRDRLIEYGNKQQELYTWDRTATLLWNSIERTLKDK